MHTLLDRNNFSSRTNGQVAARRVTGLIIKRLWWTRVKFSQVKTQDSESRLRVKTRSQDSASRLGVKTRSQDSKSRLEVKTRSQNSESRLRVKTQSQDSESRLRVMTQSQDLILKNTTCLLSFYKKACRFADSKCKLKWSSGEMTFQEQYGLMPGPNGPPSRPRYPPHQNAQPCHNWQPPPNQMGQRPYCENFRPPMGSMGPRQNYSPQRLPCRGPRPSGPRFEREPPFFPPHSAEGYRPGTMPPLPPPMGQTEYGPNQPVWETQFLPPACEQWPGGSAPGWPDGRNTMADDRQFSEADRRSVTSQPDGRQPESLCSSSDQACRLQDDTAQPRLEDDRRFVGSYKSQTYSQPFGQLALVYILFYIMYCICQQYSNL